MLMLEHSIEACSYFYTHNQIYCRYEVRVREAFFYNFTEFPVTPNELLGLKKIIGTGLWGKNVNVNVGKTGIQLYLTWQFFSHRYLIA